MRELIEGRRPAEGTPIKPGEITILIATRARPEMLAEVFASLKANTVRKDKTSLWLYVDEDDQITRRAIEENRWLERGKKVNGRAIPGDAGWWQWR